MYDAKGQIVPVEDTSPIVNEDNVRSKESFGDDTTRAVEEDPTVDESNLEGIKGHRRADVTYGEDGDDFVTRYPTWGAREEAVKEGKYNPSVQAGQPIMTDAFSQNPVVNVDPDTGEIIREDSLEDAYGDDYRISSGVTDSELAAINQKRTAGDQFTGQKLDAHGDPLFGDYLNNIIGDAGREVTGRQKTQGELLYGDDAGKTMKIVEGLGDDQRLISKKVLKDGPLGLNRKKEVHKKGKGGVYRDPDTGELKYTEDSVRTTVSKGPLGLGGRDVYVDGELLTKEHKKLIKDTKKKEEQEARDKKKENKKENKRIHNATKHVYKGMNTSQKQELKAVHEAAAREANMSYEDYIAENFPKEEKKSFRESFGSGDISASSDYNVPY